MKILVVKTSALGDIIQSYPVLQLLREAYPNAQIDWVVEKPFSSLLQGHPSVDNILLIHTKMWRGGIFKFQTYQEIKGFVKKLRSVDYDLIFDLQSNLKSGLITLLAKGKRKIGFGKESVHEWPNLLFTNEKYNPPKNLNIREDYLYLAESAINVKFQHLKGVKLKITEDQEKEVKILLNQPSISGASLKVLVCPGSNWTSKQLDKETLKLFLKSISRKYNAAYVFIWGTEEEKQFCQTLAGFFQNNSVVAVKMSLPTLQNLMNAMDLVISMDSLPLHLAATTDTLTYSIFGPSLANKYMPIGENHAAYQGSCPYGKTFEKRCPILRTCATASCMKDIDAKMLFEDFEKWFTVAFSSRA